MNDPAPALTDATAVAAAKQQAWAAIDERRDLLLDVSHRIWDQPELAFEEHAAHDLLCDVLDGAGLSPTRHAYGLDTAFAAEAGTSGPLVGVLCEYDALPGIGHACGHNVIAAAGIGAGIVAASLAESLGGRVRILGTPAEEGGGGKVHMMREGALDGLDAAMMIHGADHDLPTITAIAIQQLFVDFQGKAAHAAAAPERGLNALDAAVLGYVNVAALRQHIRTDERIHGVFTDGGDKPNIVPAHAGMHWYIRSATLDSLEVLKARVLSCLEAGAQAAGCTMEHRWHDPAYADLLDDQWLLQRYADNAAALGRTLQNPDEVGAVVGSTDMGNVSHEVPSIHPMIAVAPPGTAIHTLDFAEHARGEGGDRAVLDGAKALVATVIDRWAAGSDPR
ncbi:MAG: M20 family metallopeptidase [Acidimicrobiales bacterium]